MRGSVSVSLSFSSRANLVRSQRRRPLRYPVQCDSREGLPVSFAISRDVDLPCFWRLILFLLQLKRRQIERRAAWRRRARNGYATRGLAEVHISLFRHCRYLFLSTVPPPPRRRYDGV